MKNPWALTQFEKGLKAWREVWRQPLKTARILRWNTDWHQDKSDRADQRCDPWGREGKLDPERRRTDLRHLPASLGHCGR